jgi:hypothetical protein
LCWAFVDNLSEAPPRQVAASFARCRLSTFTFAEELFSRRRAQKAGMVLVPRAPHTLEDVAMW